MNGLDMRSEKEIYNYLRKKARAQYFKNKWFFDANSYTVEDFTHELYLKYMMTTIKIRESNIQDNIDDIEKYIGAALEKFIKLSFSDTMIRVRKTKDYVNFIQFNGETLNEGQMRILEERGIISDDKSYSDNEKRLFKTCKKYLNEELTSESVEKFIVFLLNVKRAQTTKQGREAVLNKVQHGFSKTTIEQAIDDAIVKKSIKIFEQSGLKVGTKYGKLGLKIGIENEVMDLINQGFTNIDEIKCELEKRNYFISHDKIRGHHNLSVTIKNCFNKKGLERPVPQKNKQFTEIREFIIFHLKASMQNREIRQLCLKKFSDIPTISNLDDYIKVIKYRLKQKENSHAK